MPSHAGHKIIDKILFGRTYPDVHKRIDYMVRFLGPRHRIIDHELLSPLRLFPNDPKRIASAYAHLGADYLSTQYKKELRKRLGPSAYRAWKALMEQASKTK